MPIKLKIIIKYIIVTNLVVLGITIALDESYKTIGGMALMSTGIGTILGSLVYGEKREQDWYRSNTLKELEKLQMEKSNWQYNQELQSENVSKKDD